MKVAGIVVAAGRGTRFGGPPKQWRPLLGAPVCGHAVASLARAGIDPIVVVHHPDDAGTAAGLSAVRLVPGGATRSESVRRGLDALVEDGPEAVLIHDGARPCASAALVERVVAGITGACGAAPALPVTDALWRGDGTVEATVSRKGLWRAQTPQGFPFNRILAAHRAHRGEALDDVEVARTAGLPVAIVLGEEDNIKVTVPGDIERAARILETRMEIRVGHGYDVHAFGPGEQVALGGVIVPHDRGVVAHSDGDVALHALTDAVLGALGAGDIGTHFPPSDDRWSGAASRVFLAHAAGLAAAQGYRITHADVTVVCETPKIGPHVPAMKAAVAEALGVDAERISIKATTSERLGFTGRREGIAALATATLVRP